MKYLFIPLILLTASSANAELKIVDTDAESAAVMASAVKSGGPIDEIGSRPKVLPPAKAGDKVRLGDAIKRIVPPKWAGYSKDADFSKTVSWDEADSWFDALAQVMTASGHVATVDWAKKRLLVSGSPAGKGGAEQRRQAALAAVATTPAAQQARIQIGEKLSDAFVRWGQEVGWQVSWEAPELVAQYDYSGNKPFEQSVVEVLNALNRNGAGLDHMFFDGNRMLRVMEKKK
ncbi:MAG: toxin co-regulated pilus biosynthesis Q family protein [Sulfuritalea sp.]|nr:toxin co-regulated pilus biosynthesis Q family protein [Sulfuritalea sp.]